MHNVTNIKISNSTKPNDALKVKQTRTVKLRTWALHTVMDHN